jgi:hypothetical protein
MAKVKQKAANKPATRKTAAKKAAPRKAAPRKAAPSRAAPRKVAPSRAAPRKAAPTKTGPRKTTPRRSAGGRVVEILDDNDPIDALRRFLATIEGDASVQQGEIALGSAQLMLQPIAHEHRGGAAVKDLVDLVLSRWFAFPDTAGFHAQEFLRNAFAAIGDDRKRFGRLITLVPTEASAELRLSIAAALAVLGDKLAMLEGLAAALATGATAAQVRRDPDFAAFLDDRDLERLLEGAATRAIPINVRPYVRPVRVALDSVISTLKEFGERPKLNPPAALDTVLAIERGRRIQLPNDYRALLTLSDGMTLWDNEFFGTLDYRTETKLAKRAKEFLAMSADHGATSIEDCIPIANWGQPNDWLLYDPRGAVREGEPGYVVMLTADPFPMKDLAEAFERIEALVREVLGTN